MQGTFCRQGLRRERKQRLCEPAKKPSAQEVFLMAAINSAGKQVSAGSREPGKEGTREREAPCPAEMCLSCPALSRSQTSGRLSRASSTLRVRCYKWPTLQMWKPRLPEATQCVNAITGLASHLPSLGLSFPVRKLSFCSCRQALGRPWDVGSLKNPTADLRELAAHVPHAEAL